MKPDRFPLQTKYSRYIARPEPGFYEGGRKAIRLVDVVDESPIMTATVNIPDAPLEDDEVYIKNWSENEGVLEAMIKAGYIEEPHDHAATGFVVADRCRLTEKGKALFA